MFCLFACPCCNGFFRLGLGGGQVICFTWSHALLVPVSGGRYLVPVSYLVATRRPEEDTPSQRSSPEHKCRRKRVAGRLVRS